MTDLENLESVYADEYALIHERQHEERMNEAQDIDLKNSMWLKKQNRGVGISTRLKAACRSFKNPCGQNVDRERELESLVNEIYVWTEHKDTYWAKRAKKALWG